MEPQFPPRWRPSRKFVGKPALGLIASEASASTAERFLTECRETLKDYFVFVTWGTYCRSIRDTADPETADSGRALDAWERAKNAKGIIPWQPRHPWLGDGYVLRPGKWGGIIEMAEHLEKSAGTDAVHVLIFFASPGDVEESYPEDRALLRSALRNEVLYLSTYTTARLWALHESAKRGPDREIIRLDPREETLALIAHDAKKVDLCRWVVEHRQHIREFQRIVTTGTTGSLVKRFLSAAGIAQEKIDLILQRSSGPHGGDIEIAGEVLRRECQNVVFFVDPMTSHAHEGDIQALLRVCAMPDIDVNLRLNEASASSWIGSLK